VAGPEGTYPEVAISRGGRWLGFVRRDPADDNVDVWLQALPGGAPSRLTSDPDIDHLFTISHDERDVAWEAHAKGTLNLMRRPVDGSSPAQLVRPWGRAGGPVDWSPDGRVDPEKAIDAFRQAHPDATPWDLWILIATDHPRGTYARETATRKAAQAAAPAYLYRFDWETPEGGGHMRSPHTVEIPFVFNNIRIAGPLISTMPAAYALADKVSASWVAFARTGNPNVASLPEWPVYSAAARDTMLFNDTSRVEQDPDRGPRLAMERELRLPSHREPLRQHLR